MRGNHRKKGYKFTEKTHSKLGIAAVVLAFILLAAYGTFVYLAFVGDGNLPVYYGSAGVLAMLVSFVGVVLAVRSMREENSFQLFPRMGLLLSLLDVVCWVGTYALGWM